LEEMNEEVARRLENSYMDLFKLVIGLLTDARVILLRGTYSSSVSISVILDIR